MASWQVPDFLDELKTRLRTRLDAAGQTGVVVSSGFVGAEHVESIQFPEVTGEQSWAALGNQTKNDIFTVTGVIFIVKPGADEAVIKETRDRAAALLAYVEADLKDGFTTLDGNQIRSLNLSNIDLKQGATPDGRAATIEFNIDVNIRI